MLGSRSTRLRSRAGGSLVAALVGATALTGCGGDDETGDQGDDGTPTSSPSVTGSGTGSASPTPTPSGASAPEPPKADRRPASREAFTRFVVEAWGYALRTNDASAVTDLSPRKRPCEGCRELQAELRKRKQEEWYVDFPGAKVRKVRVTPGKQVSTWTGTAVIDIPASRSYFEDGTFRNDNAAHEKATFEVGFRLDGKRWTLLAFSVG